MSSLLSVLFCFSSFCCPRPRTARLRAKAFTKIAYSAPDVPSMFCSITLARQLTRATASTSSSSSPPRCSPSFPSWCPSGVLAAHTFTNSAIMASAPLFRPVPQSPSPEMVSYCVICGSAAMTRRRPAVRTLRVCEISMPRMSWEGGDNSTSFSL